MKKLAAAFVCAAVFLTASFTVCAQKPADDINALIDGIYEYKLSSAGCDGRQEWIDTYLTANAGRGAEWYALTAARTDFAGEYGFSRYIGALSAYLKEKDPASATTRQKCALTLIAVGDRDNPYIGEVLKNSVGEQGVMSLIYGLHLLNNVSAEQKSAAGVPAEADVIEELMSQRHEDGGWSVMGEHGDVDVTAMALQALAPYADGDARLAEAALKALDFLSEKQQPDGGYKGFGAPNPESASQVAIALSSLGIDLRTDERFIKNGCCVFDGITAYRLSDGSFTHEAGGASSETATVQALMAYTSYTLFKEGEGRLYELGGRKAPSAEDERISESEDLTEALPQSVGSFEFTPEKQSSGSYKPAALIGTGALAVAAWVILFLLGKRRLSNFVSVAVTAGILAGFILFTDFKSAEEYYGEETVKTDPVGSVTMSISCSTVAEKLRQSGETLPGHIPADGTILAKTDFAIEKGETVLDILKQAAKRYGIQMQSDAVGYVSGIGYLYEFEYGQLSGWIYHVNGSAPFVHCSEYALSDGDDIEWLYTCDLGYDLGDVWQEE